MTNKRPLLDVRSEIEQLREQLAEIEHQRWADWQAWCHKILRDLVPSPALERVLERWDRQIATQYKDLSPEEKASDMEQVDRYWHLIEALLDRVRISELGEGKTPHDSPKTSFRRNTDQMVKDIDELVSGDWGFSVTDDMVNLPNGKYKKFTQEQAEEMSTVIGKVFMIAHGIHCDTCGAKYTLSSRVVGAQKGKKDDK